MNKEKYEYMAEVRLKHDVLIMKVSNKHVLSFPRMKDATSIVFYDVQRKGEDDQIINIGHVIYYAYRMPALEALENGIGDGTCDLAICDNGQIEEMGPFDTTFDEVVKMFTSIYGEEYVKRYLANPDENVMFVSSVIDDNDLEKDFYNNLGSNEMLENLYEDEHKYFVEKTVQKVKI